MRVVSIKTIFPCHPTFIFPMPSIHRKSDSCRHDFILAPVKSWESRISNTAANLEQGRDWLALLSVMLFMTLCLLSASIFRAHGSVFPIASLCYSWFCTLSWPLRQWLIFFFLFWTQRIIISMSQKWNTKAVWVEWPSFLHNTHTERTYTCTHFQGVVNIRIGAALEKDTRRSGTQRGESQ